MANVLLFTDSFTCRDGNGGFVPVRDAFPHFIAPLAEHFDRLVLASRCSPDCGPLRGLGALPVSARLRFEPLPFYANTEDFYRRRFLIYRQSLSRIRALIREADIVVLRIHHAMALEIWQAARTAHKPLVAYWAGATISDTSRANYPGLNPKHILARLVASWKQRQHRRIAHDADRNLFIDPIEYAQLGDPPRTQWIVPTLVTPEAIAASATPRPDTELTVAFGGRIYRHKGVFELLDAVRGLLAQGKRVRLWYAGDGPHIAELRARIAAYALDPMVSVLGPVSHAELQTLLGRAHVFALPSRSESLPKTLWEAWSRGLASILSPVGAIPAHVRDGENGLLVAPGSPLALQDAIARLYDDEALRTRLATNGLKSAREHTWDREISAIANGIASTVAEPPLPRQLRQ